MTSLFLKNPEFLSFLEVKEFKISLKEDFVFLEYAQTLLYSW